MQRYYSDGHKAAIEAARTYADLASAGIAVLQHMHGLYAAEGRQIVQICGPMSTGGRGSLEENMLVFAHAIRLLDDSHYFLSPGEVPFDQIPCQDAIKRIAQYKPGDTAYDQRILTDFYEPLFGARIVKACYFLPGWETSHGARWERDIVPVYGIAVKEYPQGLYEAAIRRCGF